MKVVLLHDRDGITIAANLLMQIKKYEIEGVSFLFDRDWEIQSPPLDEIFGSATHLVAIPSKSAVSVSAGPPWFSFVLGFSRGSGSPLVYYGAETGSIAPQFLKGLIRVKNNEEFIHYLAREVREWTRAYIMKKAQQTLLERGISVTLDSLCRCIAEKDSAAVSLFLQAGFPPDTLDKAGVPLLCLAARAGSREIVAVLLKAGAQVNLKALDRGGSALIDAALGKYNAILGDLLAAGADANIKSKDGQSALIITVGLDDEPAVEMLLKVGADPDEPDSLGASARKYAALFNRPGMVNLFKAHALCNPEGA